MKNKTISNHIREKWIYIYYLLLIFILVSRQEATVAPNMVIRLGYLGLLLVPAFFLRNSWLPVALTCTITIAQYGFAYSYLPSEIKYIAIPLLIAVFLYGRDDNRFYISKVYIIFLILIFFVEFITSGRIGSTFWGPLAAVLMSCFLDDNKQSVEKMSIAFIMASFVLSTMYILFRDNFLVDYTYSSGLERADWIDPNYFSMVINMGAIVALSKLYSPNISLPLKIFYIVTIAISLMSVALLASRGALLAFCAATLIIVLFSKGKKTTKAIVIVGLIFFSIFLLNNQYFELVSYRFANDAGGGSGRLGIWQNKIQAWGNGNVFSFIFGFGTEKSASLSGEVIGFHNDFLAVLVEYGIVGFCLFMIMWITPIRNAIKLNHNKVIVFAFMTFMTIECCTLEPLTLGRIPFWMFFIYILLVSKQNDENKADHQTS